MVKAYENFTSNKSTKNVYEKRFLNLNLFLKALLFTCLFYVLSSKDTHDYVYKNLLGKISHDNSLYVSMVVFFLVYYLVSVFL